MWKFNPFGQKEQAGLEGRVIDVGNVKVCVRNAIAEGGFSCVYLSRDALHPSKQYAVKHMISNDAESLELVKKEILVMKLLKGHPNIVTLVSHSIIDMGRTKEAFLVMEFCEKSLVGVLDGRGAGYFEEKQILLIFRDVCNALFAMHNQSPPIAHRDIKVENVLLGSDGAWKLCDFGSTSTNHKRFDRPEEMGIEEDNIRKYTTPAYRAPEMWDLYRKEVISEKVDIWALGCILYRLCYFKSAFDGESKLQILNGNYKIPESPKYNLSIIELINDMLQSSPDSRPDITQIWFRVNEQLPIESQKDLPDGSPSSDVRRPLSDSNNEVCAGHSKKAANPMPRRSPPPPPSREQARNASLHSIKDTSKTSGSPAPIGSFWSSQHVQESHAVEEKAPVYDEEPSRQATAAHSRNSRDSRISPARESIKTGQPTRSTHVKTTGDIEINFFPKSSDQFPENSNSSVQDQGKVAFQNEAFDTLVADFDTSKFNLTIPPSTAKIRSVGKEEVEEQVGKLEEQLKQANMEKADILSKYEKLSAICRSQRQELQELKQALAAASSSEASIDSSNRHSSTGGVPPATLPREKIEGTVWELQEGMFATSFSTPSPDQKPWQAFPDEPKQQPATVVSSARPKSVRTTNGRQNSIRQQAQAKDSWGFDQDEFSSAAAAPGAPLLSKNSASTQDSRNTSGRFTRISAKKPDTEKPAGWADF